MHVSIHARVLPIYIHMYTCMYVHILMHIRDPMSDLDANVLIQVRTTVCVVDATKVSPSRIQGFHVMASCTKNSMETELRGMSNLDVDNKFRAKPAGSVMWPFGSPADEGGKANEGKMRSEGIHNASPLNSSGGYGEWSSGIWDCCASDAACKGLFCPFLLAGDIASAHGAPKDVPCAGSWFGACCCYALGVLTIYWGGTILQAGCLSAPTRVAIRRQHGIDGSAAADCCLHLFCSPCALIQVCTSHGALVFERGR